VLLLVAIVLGVGAVPLTGGRLSRLANVRLRLVPAIFAALLIQVVITSVASDGGWIDRVLYLLSYCLAGCFLVANRKIPGMWVVAAGTSLNALAIAANNGVMPASRSALRTAGLATSSHGFANSTLLLHPRLLLLGDVLAVPASLPLHNVYSVGDVCILIGAVIAIHMLCRVKVEEHSELPSPDMSTSR
jgi:hypothetical protein